MSQRKEVYEVDAQTLEVKKTVNLGQDLRSCALVKTGAATEVWVGDKKGMIHVLAGDSVEKVAEF